MAFVQDPDRPPEPNPDAPAASDTQFYIRTTDVTGTTELPEGVEMVMPGDNIKMKIKLIYPVALERGLRFAIREGGKTVGAGTISSILE